MLSCLNFKTQLWSVFKCIDVNVLPFTGDEGTCAGLGNQNYVMTLCDHATVALRSTRNGIKCNTCSLVEVILTKPMKSWTSLSSKSAFQKAVGGRRRDRACEREEVSEVQTNGWCCGVWIHARGGWRCPGAERDSCAECEHSLELNSKSQTNLKPRT